MEASGNKFRRFMCGLISTASGLQRYRSKILGVLTISQSIDQGSIHPLQPK
jgi:hypothetical protein